MNIKILCSCGTKFSFDVEPADEKMPADVFCPACGTNVTDSANAAIQQKLPTDQPISAETALPKPRVRLHVSTPVSTPSETVLAAVNAVAPAVEMCQRHPRNVATAHCVVCQKAICPECMQSFGYLCSVNCRYRAEQEKIRVPDYKFQRDVAERGGMRKMMAVAGVVALLLGALVAAWFWYILSGSKPRTFYTLKLPPNQATSAQFLGPDQILLRRRNEVALHSIATKKDLWSTSLDDPNPARAATSKSAEDESTADADIESSADYLGGGFESNSQPFFHGNDLWLCLAHRVVCLDVKTGSVKYNVPFAGHLESFTPGDPDLLVVSRGAATKMLVAQISVETGEVKKTEVVTMARERVELSKDLPNNVLPTAALLMKYEMEGAQKNQPSVYKSSSEFFPSGQGLVEMDVKLVEVKISSVQTMKTPGKSNLGAETRASTSTRAVMEELSNEMKRNRGGGIRSVDESRYAVTLRRVNEPGATDWRNEVIGVPMFFPQKSVDLLVAGKVSYFLDKKNKLIGQSQLQFPIDDHFTSGERPGIAPAMENNNTLFLFDKGVLTTFDLPEAKVRWRLPSVGISRIQFDEKGMLYVSTTTAAPEDIQYSEQIKITDAAKPIVLKVDPKSGKTLWKSEQYAEGCFLTGKYLYMTDAAR
ncbi:MAG: B-box zinc finger protein, partial [Verrucomicrobiota bacterium]